MEKVVNIDRILFKDTDSNPNVQEDDDISLQSESVAENEASKGIDLTHVHLVKPSSENMFSGFLVRKQKIPFGCKFVSGVIFKNSDNQDFIFIEGGTGSV